MLKRAKVAKREIMAMSTEIKNAALVAMAQAMKNNASAIIEANEQDMEAAKDTVADVMLDRLMINEERIDDMVDGMLQVAALEDPAGRVLETTEPHTGLVVKKVSAPIGVIAIIYESRPNVTADAAALTIKSGNACVLRGGKEAIRTTTAIVEALREGLSQAGVTPDALNLVTDTSRESATVLMKSPEYIDLLIPRGGAGLIRNCVENATVPCIATGTGICHVYVDGSADLDMAINIVNNAKTSRPSVCNAEEVLLVDGKIANEFLPRLYTKLVDERKKEGQTPVELRLDAEAAGIISGVVATDEDFDTEFLDYILAVHVVDGVDEAIEHISKHSTGHSDAIVAEDTSVAQKFSQGVDSSSVYINASTRFTDGGEFGLGCEIGISTQKLHARGPMGLREMNTYKYVIEGNGHIR